MISQGHKKVFLRKWSSRLLSCIAVAEKNKYKKAMMMSTLSLGDDDCLMCMFYIIIFFKPWPQKMRNEKIILHTFAVHFSSLSLSRFAIIRLFLHFVGFETIFFFFNWIRNSMHTPQSQLSLWVTHQNVCIEREGGGSKSYLIRKNTNNNVKWWKIAACHSLFFLPKKKLYFLRVFKRQHKGVH